jgi:transcriptional regulator with XRE-family HTH domain
MRLTDSMLARYGQDAGFITAQERADAIGFSRSHLLHVERGDFMPSPAMVDAMARVYNQPDTKIERAARTCVENLAQRKINHMRFLDQ